MSTWPPRSGEHIVNTHTGRTKPDDEPYDTNKHGYRCYHADDVAAAIDHWGTFNGRDADKYTALELVDAQSAASGGVREVFHIEMYVAVTFGDRPDTVGAYINTGFIDSTSQATDSQFWIERGYWRHEFAGYGGARSSPASSGSGGGVGRSECPCSPGIKVPIDSECLSCGEVVS